MKPYSPYCPSWKDGVPFSQLKVDDKFFVISKGISKYEVKEFVISKPWYSHSGRFYIKGINKNTGTETTFMLGREGWCHKSNIVVNEVSWKQTDYIGTDFDSVSDYLSWFTQKEINHAQNELRYAQQTLDSVTKSFDNLQKCLTTYKK